MKKLIVLFSAAFLAVSVIGQNSKNHSGFLSKISKQRELSVPGISDNFLNFHVQPKSIRQLPHLKNASAVKQRLDSLVYAGSDKDEFVYDASGKMIRDTYSEWDGNWINSSKDEYEYDSNGNQTLNVSFEWDGTEWMNSWKNEYYYDSNGNNTKQIFYEWGGNNWVNVTKNESVYDGYNNLIQKIDYSGNGNDWNYSQKNDNEYDSNGNNIVNSNYYWDGVQWINYWKNELAYDENGNDTLFIGYIGDGDAWVTSGKAVLNYDSLQNLILYKNYTLMDSGFVNTAIMESFYNENNKITNTNYSLYYEWNNQWELSQRDEYSYDDNLNLILKDIFSFSENQWVNIEKEESVYDEYGNRLEHTYSSMYNNPEQLLPEWKDEYAYDNNFSFEDLILPFTSDDIESASQEGSDITLMFKHKLTHLTYYESDGSDLKLIGDYTLFYSEQNITGVNQLNLSGNVAVYPNPATNQVTFNVEGLAGQLTVELYDIQGKLVLSKKSENNRPVSIEVLNEGLYFYRLSDELSFYTGKFMVK